MNYSFASPAIVGPFLGFFFGFFFGLIFRFFWVVIAGLISKEGSKKCEKFKFVSSNRINWKNKADFLQSFYGKTSLYPKELWFLDIFKGLKGDRK